MEQDLERSEEKVELSDRFVTHNAILSITFLMLWLPSLTPISWILKILIKISVHFRSKIVELEEELRVVGNNLKSLEVSEEKVCLLFSIIVLSKMFQLRLALLPKKRGQTERNIIFVSNILYILSKQNNEQKKRD